MAGRKVAEIDSVRRVSAAMDVDAPLSVTVRPRRQAAVQFARFTLDRGSRQIVTQTKEDMYVLALALDDIPAHEVCYDGKQYFRPLQKKGVFTFIDKAKSSITDLPPKLDNVHAYFPKTVFKVLADDQAGFGEVDLGFESINAFSDIVVKSLGHCLLPTFQRAGQANGLFLDHVAMALLTHIAVTYGRAKAPKFVRGGLSPRQTQRAKDVLMSRLDGEITLQELARECGLSRSHFARAFKTTTGLPPHRWLMERRLERARELLLHSKLSLAEISDASGFADQSHFTRCFSAAAGISPREWRRLRCG